jgi:PAS domain S-box-containing protein
MGALAQDLAGTLSPRLEEEMQRLQPVDFRVAALLIIPGDGSAGAKHQIGYATKQFCEMTGYEGPDIVGHPFEWLAGPDTDPVALSDFLAALDNDEATEVDLLAYTKAGVSFWGHFQVQPVKRGDGITEGFAVYLSHAEKTRASYLSEAWQKIEDAWTSDRRDVD